MDRKLFHEANLAYQRIKQAEEKKIKLLGLKEQIIEILNGHTEIPEEEIYDTFNMLKKLSGYLDIEIRKLYETIDSL